MIAVKEGEQGHLGGAMWGRVVVEFGGGKELYPFGWVVGTEDAEIGFKFLIGSFRLSIGLGMIGSGESYVVSKEAC